MDETDMNRLTDVAFVIPVRIDSPERSRNLDVLIDFIIRYFDSNILVMESDSQRRYFVKNDSSRIHYFFENDSRAIFHHTRCLNLLYTKVDAPIMACCDVDVIAPPEQIVDTVEQVRCGKAMMGLPYDGRVYETTSKLAQIYSETQNMETLLGKANDLKLMYGDLSIGGIFIVETKKYLQSGGENEFFFGWGCEDFERVKRMEILYPQPVYFAGGGLFHLWHPRGLNSWYVDRQHERNGIKEYLKVCGMTEKKLRNYIKSWPWLESLQK